MITADSERAFTTIIRTTPDRLWEALTTPALTRRYFYHAEVDSTWVPGEHVAYRAADGQVLQEGDVLSVDSPSRLAIRCRLLFDPVAREEAPFRMTWTIEPLEEYCRLRLNVDELKHAPRAAELTSTLGPTLGHLKTLLETGHLRPVANITIDCHDPALLAAFWSSATGYLPGGGGDDWAALDEPNSAGPRMLFMRVPEPKIAKNRVHLDLNVENRTAEAARLIGLGATQLRIVAEQGEGWTVMADPEGNEFCIQ